MAVKRERTKQLEELNRLEVKLRKLERSVFLHEGRSTLRLRIKRLRRRLGLESTAPSRD